MPRAGNTHDLTIESVGNGCSRRGFMLRRRRDGSRGASVHDRQVIAQRVLTSGPLEATEFPPDIESIHFQRNWELGIGAVRDCAQGQRGEHHFLNDVSMIDASGDGRIRLAQELRTTGFACCVSTPCASIPSGFSIVGGSELWASLGRDLYQWSFANNNWTSNCEPQAAAVTYRNGVEYKCNTVMPSWDICGHTPNRYIFKADADCTWNIIGAGCGTQVNGVKFLAKAQNACNNEILWGGYIRRANCTYGPNVIVSTTDPETIACWSSEVSIGECDAEITNLQVGDCNRIFVFKENGIWTYARNGTVTNITPWLENSPHPCHFRAAAIWGVGRVVASMYPDDLIEVLPGQSTGGPQYGGGAPARYTVRDISLKHAFPTLEKYHNPVVALRGDHRHLYALVHNASCSEYYLMKADVICCQYAWFRLRTIGYCGATCQDETALFIEGLSQCCSDHDRLWVGIQDGNCNNPFFYPTSDIDASFGYTNDCGPEAITVQLDFGVPRLDKRLEGVSLETRNVAAGRTISLDFRLDGACCWTTWFTINCGNNFVCRDFPAGTSAKIAELRVKPSLTCVGDTSPELLSLRLKGQIRPDPVKSIPMSLYLADCQQLLNGATESRTKGNLIQLRNWDSQAAEVIVRTKGIVGLESRNAVFVPGTLVEEEVRFDLGRRPEYRVQFMVSDVRATKTNAKYGQALYSQAIYGET